MRSSSPPPTPSPAPATYGVATAVATMPCMARMDPFGIPRPPPPASLLSSHVSDLLGPGRYDVDRSARALETHGRLPSNRGTTGFVAPWAATPRASTTPSPRNNGAPTTTTSSSPLSSATAPASALPPAPIESLRGVPDPGPGAYDVYKASAALETHGRGPSALGSPGMVRDTNGAPNPGLLDRSSPVPGPGVYNVGTASRATEVRIGFGASTRGTAGFVAPSARRRRPRSAITTTLTGRRDAGGAARPHSALVRGGTEGTSGADGTTTGTAGEVEVGGTAGEAHMRRTLEGTPEDTTGGGGGGGNGRGVAAIPTDVEADLLPEPGPGAYDVGRAKQATERRQGASNKGSAGFVPGSSRVRPIVYSNTAGGTAPYGMCAPTCPEGDVGGASSALGEAVWRAGSETPSAAFGPSSTGRFNYQEREEEIEGRGGGGHRGHRGHAGQGGEGGRVRGRSEGSALVPRRPGSPRRPPSKAFHIVVGRVGTPESRREAARFNSRLYGGVQDAQFALGGAAVRDLGSSSSSSTGIGAVRSGARSTDHHQHRQQEGMHDASSPPRPETHATEDRGVLVSRAVSLLRTLVGDNHNVGVPQTMMTPAPTDVHAHGDMMMMMALPASSVNGENEENGQSGESGEWRGSDDERGGGGSSDGGNEEDARILIEQSWQRRLDRHFQKTGPRLIAQDALSWHKGGGARVARAARATRAARSSSRRRRRGPAAVSQSKPGRFLRAKAAGWEGTHGGGSGGSGGDGGHSPAAPQGWDSGPRTAQHHEARGGGGGRALDTWSNKARAATAGNWDVGSGRVKATGDNGGGGQENLFALDRSRPSTPRFPPNHFARPATHIYRTSTSVW